MLSQLINEMNHLSDWIIEKCFRCNSDDDGARTRLHSLSASCHHEKPDYNPTDCDNALLDHLMHESHAPLESDDVRTFSNWLHPSEDEPRQAPMRRATKDFSELDSRLSHINKTGMGLESDCVNSFVGSNQSEQYLTGPHTKTVRDLPVLKMQDFKRMEELRHESKLDELFK